MRLAAPLAVLVALGTLVAVAAAQSVSGTRPECVTASAASRWNAAGFNHNVTIRNACDYAVHCSVSTDANPELQRVDVAAGAERFVTTYLDSPASGFVATVDCER